MRVLILEDDPILQFDVTDMVKSLGHEVVGPLSDEASAREVLKTDECDAAILDYNLGSGTDSREVADMLIERGVRIAFTTGHSRAHLPERFADYHVIEKPYRDRDISAFLDS